MITFPTSQLEVIPELYLGSRWVDVVSDVQLRGTGIRISRGRANEATAVAPSKCGLSLNNAGGKYSPRNPLGAYYGTLGRNTPLRVALRLARDTFSTTASNGWGTSTSGDAWSIAQSGGTSADFAVNSGVGKHTVGTAATYRLSYAAGVTMRDVDVAVTVSLPFTNVTGGQVEPANLVLRGVSTSDYYLVRVVITTAEAVTVQLMNAAGTTYSSAVTVAGLTHTSAQSLRVRAQFEGQTMRAKVWAVDTSVANSTGEPYDWTVTAHVSDAPRTGWVGVRTGAGTGNTNVSFTASYDDWEVRSPRWAGEVSNWPPKWDLSLNDAWTPIEGRGPLRRLGQGKTPARSAPRAYIPTSDPNVIAYWPLEDGPLSATGRPVIGANDMILTSDLAARQHFGQGDMGPFLAPGLRLRGGTDRITGWVDSPSGAASEWTVDHLRAGGRDTNTIITIDVQGISGSFTARQWLVEFLFATSEIRITPPGAGATTMSVSDLYDDAAHHVRIFVEQDGADVHWWIDVDSTPIGNGAVAAMTLTYPYSVQILDQSTHTQQFACQHVVVYKDSRPLSNFAYPVLGWAGETALNRMIRLCSENNIPFSYQGDPAATAAMGPQGVKPVLELLRECADTDRGTLYETRGTAGLAYRARASIYNQTAAATLPFGALTLPFDPTDDDQSVRNDVTVKTLLGSEVMAEQTTGPLSTADPWDGGAGRYDTQYDVNVNLAGQLADLAGWLLHEGTADELRFPVLTVDRVCTTLANDAATSRALLDLDVDDRLVVTGASSVYIYDDINQIARGYNETLNISEHAFGINGSPGSVYEVVHTDDTTRDKVDSGTSTLASSATSGAPSLSVATSHPYDLWVTGSGLSIPIMIAGERMTVTQITGATSPQTFTVSRSQNGVVKAHTAGAAVKLARPAIVAL
ncbi:hypothetical protein Lesp02_83960 [Lentzea sp. NBRC 105346]|uniref:hypothetical protein n=1 Tax=Lentzea sp. NBRC 105346 TaxID=3032205 RepID=UPI0024A59495|nr:hypothetical protein [Lentzea sp. NBRC 105346]GLZ36209.1 hypothetical protein Lesp02_83960 [Lentzea sp. NBRC 105346]